MPVLAPEADGLALDEGVRARLAAIPHFGEHAYRTLDVAKTIAYFRRFFVETCPIPPEMLADATIADIGGGYGFLAMAFAAHTPAKVMVVELDRSRLQAGKAIAAALGLEGRIDWRVGSILDLPLADRSVDVAYAVEVVEHVGGDPRALSELARVAAKHLVVTTPNALFPVIAHDTRLPYCHVLPLAWRDVYARRFGRAHLQDGNVFFTPGALKRHLKGFRRVSPFLQFPSVQACIARYPLYMPYNGGAMRGLSKGKAFYYGMAATLGKASCYVMPNLAGVWTRTGQR